MEKIAGICFLVAINITMCFGQSLQPRIHIKEIQQEKYDQSFVQIDLLDFKLYYSPREPFRTPFSNISDTLKAALCFGIHVNHNRKNDFLKVKSAKIWYVDDSIDWTKKDSAIIIKKALQQLKKRSYYIKYCAGKKPSGIYYINMVIGLVPKQNH